MRGDCMVDGNQLGGVGFKYLGVPYSTMDCQAFVEKCLSDCGMNKNLAGSNAWFREVSKNGIVLTPEECVKQLGKVPSGAFLFIHKNDGGEEKRGYHDGLGNATHIGLCTGSRGEGAIHSSSSRGCVAESVFKGKTIPNGGWNRVGLWNKVSYDYGAGNTIEPNPTWRSTIRKGSTGDDVRYCQQLLLNMGYDLGSCGADGDFGRKTEEAVIAFQRRNGLNPDGVVGPLTWDKLMQDTPVSPKTFSVTLHGVTYDEMETIRMMFPDAEIKEE